MPDAIHTVRSVLSRSTARLLIRFHFVPNHSFRMLRGFIYGSVGESESSRFFAYGIPIDFFHSAYRIRGTRVVGPAPWDFFYVIVKAIVGLYHFATKITYFVMVSKNHSHIEIFLIIRIKIGRKSFAVSFYIPAVYLESVSYTHLTLPTTPYV